MFFRKNIEKLTENVPLWKIHQINRRVLVSQYFINVHVYTNLTIRNEVDVASLTVNWIVT
jgi:hypothetical protein